MKDIYVLRWSDGQYYCYRSVSNDQRTLNMLCAMMTENFDLAVGISTRTGCKIFKLKPILVTDG